MLALTFQIGNDRMALDIRRVVEVVPRVRLQRPALSPPWLAGLFVCRGRVVPVVDLYQLSGLGECPPHLSSRIILIETRGASGRWIGLLAAQVAEVRELNIPAAPSMNYAIPGQADLGPVAAEGGTLIRLLNPDRLLPEALRQQVADLPKELPCR